MSVELDRVWDVLGPFPIHAREQHFLSPAYPLDLSLPIDTTAQYPTALAHTASASWSQTTADLHGVIHVSHPSVPWDQIRASEGWAGLQHVNVLRGWLSVRPPGVEDIFEPLLRTELLQGALFTILPPPDSPERMTHVPEWHYGNIYTMEKAPVQLVELPVSPARKEVTRYEVIICAPYEIRLFGDPSAYSSPHPVLTLIFSVSLQFPCTPTPQLAIDEIQLPIMGTPLQHVLSHSITPHIVDGRPFGNAVGVGVRCLDFGRKAEEHWSVVDVRLVSSSTDLPLSLSLALDGLPIRIAPTQTRIIPVRLGIASHKNIPEDVKQLDVELTCVPSSQLAMKEASSIMHSDAHPVNQSAFLLRATLPLTHVPLWTQEKHVPIQASYFFAESMPTAFVVKPPKEAFSDSQTVLGPHDTIHASKCKGNEPILALHGAGVDILAQSFWANSLPRQKNAWIIMPQGRTAWGLDWHGPSTIDAFETVSTLSRILSDLGSGTWTKWGFDADTRVIVMGHSNGGQGAWYMASRWPDRVCAVVPAAGYIKSQAYVSWCMGRFAHFVDPALRAVLDSSLTPDDNDLFLGNLVGKPVLALHGGADNNVPTWHTREQVGILKTWDPDADVTYHEDSGQPHWYPGVLLNKRVQDFLDRVYSAHIHVHGLESQKRKTANFTLTVAVPAESGTVNGWQIHVLLTPGVLGRLRVTTTPDGQVINTTNVSVFSLDTDVFFAICDDVKRKMSLAIDGHNIQVRPVLFTNFWLFVRESITTGCPSKSRWKITHPTGDIAGTISRLCAPRQRLQSILSTNAPLTLLVPSLSPSRELSAALRIAHVLQLFHALDAQIVSVSEVETTQASLKGNLVVIGCAEASLVQQWLENAGGLWTYTDGAWHLNGIRFDRPSSAILFCQPHPYDTQSIVLFLQSTDAPGLERAVRLFPIRTGVLSPDWLVVDGRADTIGAAGIQGAGVYGWVPADVDDDNPHLAGKWVWNERMSWLD